MKFRDASVLVAYAGLAACSALPAPASVATLDPSTLNTVVAQTAAAAEPSLTQTQPPTATPVSSATPLVTTTPTVAPSNTPTFIFVLASPTKPAPTEIESTDGNAYACELLSQIPADGTTFGAGDNFDTRWQVRNIGTRDWDENNVDYRYASGDDLHRKNAYDLYRSVPTGGLADILVEMKAPNKPGTYSTVWRLRVGRTSFCSLTLEIVVK